MLHSSVANGKAAGGNGEGKRVTGSVAAGSIRSIAMSKSM
jgi:hypothetical protein